MSDSWHWLYSLQGLHTKVRWSQERLTFLFRRRSGIIKYHVNSVNIHCEKLCHMLSHGSCIVVSVQLLVSYKYPHNERKKKITEKWNCVSSSSLYLLPSKLCVLWHFSGSHCITDCYALCVMVIILQTAHWRSRNVHFMNPFHYKISCNWQLLHCNRIMFLPEKMKHKSSDFHWWQSSIGMLCWHRSCYCASEVLGEYGL